MAYFVYQGWRPHQPEFLRLQGSQNGDLANAKNSLRKLVFDDAPVIHMGDQIDEEAEKLNEKFDEISKMKFSWPSKLMAEILSGINLSDHRTVPPVIDAKSNLVMKAIGDTEKKVDAFQPAVGLITSFDADVIAARTFEKGSSSFEYKGTQMQPGENGDYTLHKSFGHYENGNYVPDITILSNNHPSMLQQDVARIGLPF